MRNKKIAAVTAAAVLLTAGISGTVSAHSNLCRPVHYTTSQNCGISRTCRTIWQEACQVSEHSRSVYSQYQSNDSQYEYDYSGTNDHPEYHNQHSGRSSTGHHGTHH